MKILIDQNECAIFTEVAQHMNIELDLPALLYEIESKELAVVAIALGGIQLVETAPQPAPATLAIVESAMDEQRPQTIIHAISGNGKKKPLHLSENTRICTICHGPVVGRGPRALTCSDSCSEELKRLRLLEKQMSKLSTRVKTPIIDDEPSDQELEELHQLDELEEAGPVEGADPLA